MFTFIELASTSWVAEVAAIFRKSWVAALFIIEMFMAALPCWMRLPVIARFLNSWA